MRHLATIREIASLRPIAGADRPRAPRVRVLERQKV